MKEYSTTPSSILETARRLKELSAKATKARLAYGHWGEYSFEVIAPDATDFEDPPGLIADFTFEDDARFFVTTRESIDSLCDALIEVEHALRVCAERHEPRARYAKAWLEKYARGGE